MRRGILAGIASAAVWAAAEPLGRRIFGIPYYSDIRLLGRGVTAGPLSGPVGLLLHLANGACFGAVFARAGGRGWREGVLAAELENLGLWPGMALVDRLHPDRRSGAWPRLLTNERVFFYEVAMHALFGAVLGALVSAEDR
jgi:hypothetical protein